MKKFLALALVLLSVVSAETSFAAKKSSTAKKDDGKPQLGTSFKFSGSSLRGKYNNSMSATATVENDKYLEDLLGGRKQFEDRNQKELERN
jgi:hypothetical protein